MSQLSFRIEADWQKVQRLREEIAKLKQEIKGTDAIQNPTAFNNLNNKLQQTSKELGNVTSKIAQTAATVETDFKKKIFDASQGVNAFTEKIIAQKGVVREAQDNVRRLADAYREAKKAKDGNADGLFSQWKDAKAGLESQRSALFGLTQEQAAARLSVKKLRDEYALLRQDGLGTSQTMDLLTSKLKNIGMTVMGGMGLKELASRIISVRAEFESMETSLKVLLGGSQERLDSIMGQIKEYALASPLNTKDMVGAVQMMTSFGIEAEKSIDYLKAIGDISMGDTGHFNSLALAFSQMSAAGKLMGQDLNQMVSAGFNPLEEISRKTGKSIGQLKEEMSKGAISSKMVQDAFISVTSAGGKFYGMSAKGAETLNGQISMLQDSFDNMFNELGQKGEGVVMTAVQTATKLVENYERTGRVLLGLVTTFGIYRTAVAVATMTTNGYTLAETLAYYRTLLLEKATKLLNITMLNNPYVIAATALGTLVGVIIATTDVLTNAERAQKDYNEALKKAEDARAEYNKETEQAIIIANDDSAATDDRRKAMNTLIARYPSIIKKYIDEKGHLRDILKMKREIAILDGQEVMNEYKEEASEAKRAAEAFKTVQEAKKKAISSGMSENDYVHFLTKKQQDETKWANDWYNKKANPSWYKKGSTQDRLEYAQGLEDSAKKKIYKTTKENALSSFQETISNMNEKRLDTLRNVLIRSKNNKGATKLPYKELNGILLSGNDIEKLFTHADVIYTSKTNKKNITKKDLQDQKKSLQEQLDGLSEQEAAGKKGAAIKKKIAELTKREEAYSISTSGSKGGGKTATNADTSKPIDYDKMARERSDAERELSDKATQASIDAMEDGYEKEKAQRDFNHKKELEELEKYKRDFLQKKIADAREIFEADPKNKGKKFDASSVKLSDKEQAKFDKMKADVEKSHTNENRKAEEERIKNQRAAWQTYYKEFGTYAEKRKALQEELNDKLAEIDKKNITDGQKKAEKATIAKQYANQLDELDNSVRNSTTLMGQLFADASKKSISEIEGIIDKVEMLLAYIEAVKDENGNATINGKNVSRKDIIGMGISENSLSNLENDPTRIESTRSALDRLKGDLGAKSPFVILKRQIKDAIDEMNKGGKNNIAAGIMLISKAISDFLPKVKDFGESLGTIFGNDDIGDKIGRAADAFDGLAMSGQGVAQIMSGDIVGGAMSAVSGISKVVSALDGMFGADYSHYNDMVAKYDVLNGIWDELIDKKTRYIEKSYGKEVLQAGDEAVELVRKKQESARILGNERLNSGASIFSRSIGRRQWKRMNGKAWSQAREALGSDWRDSYDDKGKMEWLFGLSAEQLKKLKEADIFWSKLDEDVREYLDRIIDGEEQINDILEKQKEKLNQMTFDDVFDGFLDSLYKIADGSEDVFDDIGKNWQKMVNKMVINNVIGAKMKESLKGWYDKLAELNEKYADKKISDSEYQKELKKLKDEYDSFVKKTEREIESARKAGIITSEGNEEQKATINEARNLSEDTGSQIVGRLTAVQIAVESGNNKRDGQNTQLSLMNMKMDDFKMMTQQVRNIADETRSILADSYLELKGINENTGKSALHLGEIRIDIKELKKIMNDKL